MKIERKIITVKMHTIAIIRKAIGGTNLPPNVSSLHWIMEIFMFFVPLTNRNSKDWEILYFVHAT